MTKILAISINLLACDKSQWMGKKIMLKSAKINLKKYRLHFNWLKKIQLHFYLNIPVFFSFNSLPWIGNTSFPIITSNEEVHLFFFLLSFVFSRIYGISHSIKSFFFVFIVENSNEKLTQTVSFFFLSIFKWIPLIFSVKKELRRLKNCVNYDHWNLIVQLPHQWRVAKDEAKILKEWIGVAQDKFEWLGQCLGSSNYKIYKNLFQFLTVSIFSKNATVENGEKMQIEYQHEQNAVSVK